MTPNDPKLSDGRGWRDRCVVGERRRQEAAGVTAAPVRCSAWLGVRSDLRQRWRGAAKRRSQITAALSTAASGRLRCSVDGNATNGGWGAGRKLPALRTRSRTDDVERSCADESESEAQTGEMQPIAARVATWPKPCNAEVSKLVRHAARADAPALRLAARITSDLEPLDLLVTLASEVVMEGYVLRNGARTPNDPKLSDCGARRAGCGKAAGAGWAQAAGRCAAASVTRGAVRCSAWLGLAALL